MRPHNTPPYHHRGLINESLMEEGASRLAEGLNLTMGGLGEGVGDQDKTTKLQAAFLHFNKGNVAQSQVSRMAL